MSTRIFYALLISVAAAIVPWWVIIPLLAAGFLKFEWFYEGLVAAFLIDVFYGLPPTPRWFIFPFTLLSLLLFFCLPALKRRLVFWAPRSF